MCIDNIETLTIPSEYGTVTRYFQGTSPITLVILKEVPGDAHGQENNAAVIKLLHEKYGLLGRLFGYLHREIQETNPKKN